MFRCLYVRITVPEFVVFPSGSATLRGWRAG
jgi:hypothetical protein